MCDCGCKAYRSERPLEPKVGDELAVAGVFRGGTSATDARGVIVAVDGDRIVLRFPDGMEQRFSREDVRVGRLRRPRA